MKKLLTIFLLTFLFVPFTFSQTLHSYLRERAEKNLSLLVKSQDIKSRVIIDHAGITLLDKTARPDLSVKWAEMAKVINILETRPYYEMLNMFAYKGTQPFYDADNYNGADSHFSEFPTDFNNLYVAIDPGHFGGSLEASQMEGRIVKIAAGDLGTKEDVVFSEPDLAYCTALFIKEMLEAKNAVVMITRPYGAGAIGEDFASWLANGGVIRSMQGALSKHDITKEYFDKLNECLKDKANPKNRNDLFQFYKFIDFRERAFKINEFNPNITLSIHYNASDDNKFYNNRYLHPVDDNYNMMFVPGAFMTGELEKADQKLDFLRLLLSPDLDNSATLADFILDEHKSVLGVDRRADLAHDSRMEKSVIFTDKPGVYARNLVLTRMARGTVVYGESLIQDNVNEALLLGKKDITVYDPSFGAISTSSRAKQVAVAYFNGISRFLEENRKKAEYRNSLKASK